MTATMRNVSSCESCRRRHRKCIFQPGATRCNGCCEAGGTCSFVSRFQFRNTLSEDSTNRFAASATGTKRRPSNKVSRNNQGSDLCGTRRQSPLQHTSCQNEGDTIIGSSHTLNSTFPDSSLPYGQSSQTLDHCSPEGCCDDVPHKENDDRKTFLTRREANLMRTYILRLAPSVSRAKLVEEREQD